MYGYKDEAQRAHEAVIIEKITHEVLNFLAVTNNTRASFTYRPSLDDFTVNVTAQYIFDEKEETA